MTVQAIGIILKSIKYKYLGYLLYKCPYCGKIEKRLRLNSPGTTFSADQRSIILHELNTTGFTQKSICIHVNPPYPEFIAKTKI